MQEASNGVAWLGTASKPILDAVGVQIDFRRFFSGSYVPTTLQSCHCGACAYPIPQPVKRVLFLADPSQTNCQHEDFLLSEIIAGSNRLRYPQAKRALLSLVHTDAIPRPGVSSESITGNTLPESPVSPQAIVIKFGPVACSSERRSNFRIGLQLAFTGNPNKEIVHESKIEGTFFGWMACAFLALASLSLAQTLSKAPLKTPTQHPPRRRNSWT